MQTAQELHSEQVTYWNETGGMGWVKAQDATDQMLSPFAELLLAQSGIERGDHVVDLGCGCGVTTIAIADRVGPEGKVLALDVSAPMLARAGERLAGSKQVACVCADAATYKFDASADHVVSRFGVMFFGNPEAAFANIRRAMKPGGRLMFICWRPIRENPWMQTSLHAAYEHVPRLPKPEAEAPGPYSFADPARVTRILTRAGFAAPQIEPFDRTVDVACGGGIEAAVRNAMTIGPASRAIKDQPEAVKARVAHAITEAFMPHIVAKNVPLGAAVWVVSTRVA